MDMNAVVNIPVAHKFKCHEASIVKSKCVLGCTFNSGVGVLFTYT